MSNSAEAIPQLGPEVYYDPRFLTGFGTKEIVIDDRWLEVHNSNSLPFVIESVIAHNEGRPLQGIFDVAYRQKVTSDPVLQESVMGFLAQEEQLSKSVRAILQDRSRARDDERDDQDPVRSYYFSLAQDEISQRARSMDPEYNLLNLVT